MPAPPKTYKVTVNGFTFNFTQHDIDQSDITFTSATECHCIHHHASVNAKITSTDASNKNQQIAIAGKAFNVSIKDGLDQMLDQMGFANATAKQVKLIKAPMPGLVLEIAVTNGQQVVAGDKLLILEAMKMENSITIHANATIKNIAVTAGQAVEKGQTLIELE